MNKSVSFQGNITSAKPVNSRQCYQVIFEIDKEIMPEGTWLILQAMLFHSDRQMLNVEITDATHSSIEKKRERLIGEDFYLKFIKSNEKYWEFIGSAGGADEAKTMTKKQLGLSSLSDMTEGQRVQVIVSFNEWLAK